MSVRKIVSLVAFVCVMAGLALAAADNGWIAVNSRSSRKADVKLLSQAKGSLTISASLPGLEKELLLEGRTGAKGETFAQLTVPGYAYTGELGKPKLPMITAVLDVPIGAEVTVSVPDGSYREYRLSALGIDARIAPALPSVPKIAGAKPQFMIDAATYSADAMYPGKLAGIVDNSKDGGLVRGHRLVTVQLYPVQYNPATGMLRIYSDLKADVRFTGGDYAKSARLVRQNYSRDWESFIQRMVINYDASLYGAKDSLLNLPIYYDIFHGPTFAVAAQRLADWKSRKGYRVRINDAGGWTADQINDSIRLRSPQATYVAVIGDPDVAGSDGLPASATGGASYDQTDLYYAETDESGYFPDLFNARLSVQTTADADVVVDKLINYEKANFGTAGTAWLKKALFIAGYDGTYQTFVQATNRYCCEILLNNGYTLVDTLIYANGEEEARVVNAINSGRSWAVYTAHGSQNSWSVGFSGTFNTTELGQLTNIGMYTLPMGHCCLANDYQWYADCFGETWPKLQDKAGVSYYGSVNNTYWEEDDWLQRRYFDAIYDTVLGIRMNEVGRFTTWGMYWINNNTTSGFKQYYFEGYHVMNDPSMDFWTDVPHTLTVAHPGNIVREQGSFAVNVKEGGANIQGALVCGWVKNRTGQQWSAYTDASGNVNLPALPATPGDTMLVTVTKHNFDPYEGQAIVILPATVVINPASIPVNTATPVSITATDPGTGNPIPNVVFTISGCGVAPPLVDTSNGSGVANYNITTPYGEVLTVTGRKIGEGYDIYSGGIPVTGAASFAAADVSVSVADLGLSNVITPDYEAAFDASANPAGFMLKVTGCGLDINAGTGGGSVQAPGTPTLPGTADAVILKTGYNVYSEQFPCRIVYGTLAGQVTAQGSGAPLSGVELGGWVSGADTTITPAEFRVTTDGLGNYVIKDSMMVGRYDIYSGKFGYIDTMLTMMLIYGPNTFNFDIQAAPSGTVSGAVTEAGTGTPLAATVNVYRSDNGILYAAVTTDSAAGGTYSVPNLACFDYNFQVTAYRHRKAVRAVTVASGSQTENFSLEISQGDILVINDDVGSKGGISKIKEYDMQGKPIVISAAAQGAKDGESAAQMAALLTGLGYSVTQETSSATDAATWTSYDAVIWSCGSDNNPLAVPAYRMNLINYVAAGGKVLLEGGEVGHRWYNDALFASTVMHASTWQSNYSGDLQLVQIGHALATTPNLLPSALWVNIANDYDQDAMTPSNGGVAVYGTANYPADGGIIAYDAGGDPDNGNVVFYAFNFNVLADSATRSQVLQNSVEYLLRPNGVTTGSISGTVTLSGQATHGGVTVAIEGYKPVTTDFSGAYQIDSVFAGTYAVTASKANFTTGYDTVIVGDSAVTGVNFTLYPAAVDTYTNITAQDILDNNPAGIWSYITVPSGKFIVDGMRVYMYITHTYIGDLRVTLCGPGAAGDSIVLHGQTGGSTDNIAGWYPTDLVPVQPLSYFAGLQATGQWGLHVTDLVGGDSGTLNTWSLEFTHAMEAHVPDTQRPAAFDLGKAWPNPFSGKTQIKFGLPRAMAVTLAVYNIAGQRVATLVNGVLPAGIHPVTWDGSTATGQRAAGGVYFYRLMTPDRQATRRLVYIR